MSDELEVIKHKWTCDGDIDEDGINWLIKELEEEVEHRKKAVDYYQGEYEKVKKLKKQITSLEAIQDRQAKRIKELETELANRISPI